MRSNTPFSDQDSGGIDVDIARALADKLGLKLDLAWAEADEKVEDDLRNYVWKGHYMGNEIADLMLHMPVDPVFNERVKQVKLIAPYYAENLMVARDTKRIVGLQRQRHRDDWAGAELLAARRGGQSGQAAVDRGDQTGGRRDGGLRSDGRDFC
ncbi:MAG: hypothetical protein EBS54_03445 [Betaproteobacteria bacterium]|nr:hypothetical protein [Betaproteobacteria bacterium]